MDPRCAVLNHNMGLGIQHHYGTFGRCSPVYVSARLSKSRCLPALHVERRSHEASPQRLKHLNRRRVDQVNCSHTVAFFNRLQRRVNNTRTKHSETRTSIIDVEVHVRDQENNMKVYQTQSSHKKPPMLQTTS